MMRFGDRLKALRLEKGMSQEELAKAMGYHQTNLSNIENNSKEPSENVMRLLAGVDKLEVAYDRLLGWKIIDKYGPAALLEAVKELTPDRYKAQEAENINKAYKKAGRETER